MLRHLISSFWLIAVIPLSAQQTAGSAMYTESIKLDIQLPPGQEALLAHIPTERKSQKQLLFTPKATLFRDAPEQRPEGDDVNWSSEEGDMNIEVRFQQGQNALFVDLTTSQKVERRDFMGKTFLIEDELTPIQWKLTGEQKMIDAFQCQKATYLRDTILTEAWFTPQIPVPTGPAQLGGLPGLILEVSINDGQRTYQLQSLDFDPPATEALVPPQKGKKVDQATFDEIRDRKLKEMQLENGGSGGVIKIIRN